MKQRMLLLLLALLGMAACGGMGRDEYGTPLADFQVKGKVTDQSGNPIPDIEVVFGLGNVDRQKTADDGTYCCRLNNVWLFSQSPQLLFLDKDGPENGGEFADQDHELVFTDRDKVASGSGWNTGLYEKTVDATLAPKAVEK